MARKNRKDSSKRHSYGIRDANGPQNLEVANNDNFEDQRAEVAAGNLEEIEIEEISKNKRGGTFKTSVYGRPPHLPLPKVQFTRRGIPIGKHRCEFVEFLGTLARNGRHAPLHIHDWRTMPDEYLTDIIKTVKKYFIVPRGSEGWILKSVGKKWRNFKSTLKKKYYDPSKPIDVQMANKDIRVLEDQWTKLLEYWGTDETKEKSTKNKEVRGKKTMDHATGKIPFEEVAEEMKKELGHSPSRAALFKKCYSDASGNPSGSEVSRAINDMDILTSQLPSGAHDTASKDDVFSQVMGEEKNGRVRMLGFGVTADTEWGVKTSRNIPYRVFIEQQKQLEEMKVQLKKQDAQILSILGRSKVHRTTLQGRIHLLQIIILDQPMPLDH